jgi:ribosome maturation factor RimP
MSTSSKKKKFQKNESHPRSAITGRMLAEVQRLAEELCEGEGLELVHIESLIENDHCILRLYIDKEGGVNLGDCTGVSRQLGDLMDVSLQISGEYRLEVSSPGIERPLSKPADFQRFKGQTAMITTLSPVEGRSRFKGTLLGLASGEMVCMDVDGTTHEIALENIKRARLVGNIGES